MKRFSAISLLVIYLVTVIGVSISSRFCDGKIASVQIRFAAAESNHSPKNEKDNCCSDVTCFLRIHSTQEASTPDVSLNTPVLQIHVLQSALSLLLFSFEQNNSHNYFFFHSPPPRTTQPLFIRNEVFLI
jgi:hypothetical protein